jgi:type IX secretion system PorP/SprF family membrane protein
MRLSIITYLIIVGGAAMAQQENLFTQYAYNKLSFNPGVAGENEYGSITALYRDQWTGLDGGPEIQMLTVNFPTVIDRLGFGLHLQRQSIGIQSKTDLTGMYAYRIRLAKGYASVGLQLSYRNFVNDFSDPRLVAINGFDQDIALTQERFSRNIFNVGIGGYYRGPNYFFGVSVPRFIKADIDSDTDPFIANQVRHYYATAGVDIDFHSEWSFSPSVLLRVADNSPFDVDLTGLMIYRDQVHMGLNIRTGGSQQSAVESIGLLLGLRVSKSIFASIAYDFTTTEINEYENGSFEILLRYDLKSNQGPKEIQNPRYF